VGEETGVCVRDLEVVVLHRDRREQAVHELPAPGATPAIRQLDADQKLGSGHGSEGDIVVIADQLVEQAGLALRADEDRRVENQPFQRRSSV
jgi:hypothetical protein